jgi:hypothetical protein
MDWSSNGRFISYSSQVPDYRNMHIWIAELGGREEETSARLFMQHPYPEFSPQFSPELSGEAPRWLAYASNETGRLEVYVRDFPEGRCKWQVSNRGGLQPHWRGDGRELFYMTLDGTLISVTLHPGPGFEFGASQPLFKTGLRFLGLYSLWMNQYAVSRDGQRFLLNFPLPEAVRGAITAVIPW